MKKFFAVLIAGVLTVGSAIAADDTNTRLIKKYLELAEELSIARTQNLVCDVGAYPDSILDLLEGAANIPGFDPSQIGPVTRQEFKDSLRFREVTGEFKPWEPRTAADYSQALEWTTFNSQPRGIFGSLQHIELLPNGKLKQTEIVPGDLSDIKTVISHGTWSVHVKKEYVSEGYQDLVRVAFTLPGKDGKAKTRVYRFSRSQLDYKTWILFTKPTEGEVPGHYNNIQFYNEIVDECEA